MYVHTTHHHHHPPTCYFHDMITSIVIDKRSLPSVSVVSSSPGVPSPNKVYSKAVGGPVLRTSQPRQQQQQHLTTITTHVIQTTAANNNGDHQQLTNSSSSSSKPSAQRYKTELCRSYHETGLCKYGDKCQFAHGTNEVRTLNRHPKYKTVLCRTYHCTGYCPYGPRCHFLHDECGDILPPSSIIKPSIGSSISPSSSFGSDMRSSISSSRSISPMDSPTTSNYSDFGTYSDDDGSHSQITILNPADYLFLPSFVFNK